MSQYQVTNTFNKGEISIKKYELIWINIIERAEQNSTKNIDNNTPSML